MSARRNPIGEQIERLAEKLVKLVYILRRGGPASDFGWWGNQSPRSAFLPVHGYEDGLPLFDEVVSGVLRLNSEMLSEHDVQRRLAYDFLAKQTSNISESRQLENQALVDEASSHLRKLVEFEAWQDVDTPIANLLLEGDPVEFGHVTFMPLTESELAKWRKDGVPWSSKAPEAQVVARVRSPGDQPKAIEHARTQVDVALNALRAFCFPFGRDADTWRVGVLGDIISAGSTPMRIGSRRHVTKLGPGIVLIDLRRHVLSKQDEEQRHLVSELIRKPSLNSMEKKLLSGVHWLGQSTKPDTNDARFAKICFALEAMIGGEPSNEYLSVRGITAMLAERAAFLAGEHLDDRWDIDRKIRKHYGIRSDIVHKGEGKVSFQDLDEFGQLVRRVALALLERVATLGDELATVDQLERWARSQRYTLPEQEPRESPRDRNHDAS